MNRFKELRVWQEAADLAVYIYSITSTFPENEKYSLTSQINSISANIAEGAGRFSKKEFKNFLGIANASCCELESHLYIANKLNFINNELTEKINAKIHHIQNMIFKLKQTLTSKTEI
jgi:four helix bundle protein